MCLYISEFLWALCLHSSIHLCAVSCVSMWVCLPLARLIQWFGAYHRNKLWCEWLLLVQTRYIAAWDKENYPAILLSSNQAFELHGMGSLYKDNMGKVAMYINTVKGVGENGRGGGQVTSAIKLPVGQWHTIWVEKTADQLCMVVDVLHRTCANRTVPVEDFRMKTPGSISYPVGVNMESRNFVLLPAGSNGAGGDGGATSGTCSVDVGATCGGLLGFNLVNTCDKKFGPTDCTPQKKCKCKPGYCVRDGIRDRKCVLDGKCESDMKKKCDSPLGFGLVKTCPARATCINDKCMCQPNSCFRDGICQAA